MRCFHSLRLQWQRHIRQLSYQKIEVCVVNLLAAILVTKESKVLEKKVNETQVSKPLFSHLNNTILKSK